MRKIIKGGIVVGFLDEGNRLTSKDSFLSSINQSGVPQCSVTRKGRATSVAVNQNTKVFPDSTDYVISLKRYLEDNGYVFQMMGDML